MCKDHHTQSDNQNCIAPPAFLNINSFSFKSLRHENPNNSLLENKLCLLTWNQVENRGNYPDDPNKTWQNVPQLFVYFRCSIIVVLDLDNYIQYHFRHVQFEILPGKIKQTKRQALQSILQFVRQINFH